MVVCFSLLAPVLGPLLLALGGRSRLGQAAVDGFVLFFVTGLLVLHVVPEAIAALGVRALPALLAGLLLPKLLHAHDHGRPGAFLGALGTAALLGHALTDGLAVAAAQNGESARSLLLAMAAHRTIEGMGVWWLLSARLKTAARALALTALVLASGLGFAGGQWALGLGVWPIAHLLQVAVAGSLLHVLVWHPPADAQACSLPRSPTPPRRWRWASSVGALAAMALLFAMEDAHGHAHGPEAVAHAHRAKHLVLAGQLVWLCLPAAVCATVCAWLGHAWLGHRTRPRWAQGRLGAAWQGAALGLLVPTCSCGVVALAQARRREGMRASGVLAYLCCAPALGWVGFALSVVLLGPVWAAARAVGLILCATGAACAAAPASMGAMPPAGATHSEPPSGALARLGDGLQFAAGEMLDFTAPWLAFACAMGAAFAEPIAHVADAHLPASWAALAVLSALALPAYLCGAASTVVAFLLSQTGVSPGASLAFAWLCSGMGLANVLAARRWVGGRRAAAWAGAFVTLCVLGAAALDAAWRQNGWVSLLFWPVQPGEGAQPRWLWASVAAAAVWRALVRQGARGFLGQILWANQAQTASGHHP